MRMIHRTLLLFGILVIIFSCQQKSQYERLVEKELASGVRNDSLFFGLSLGMNSKDFYAHCWELNKQGLIRQGATNTSVYYEITDFNYPAGMDFYPQFFKEKVVQMPVIFSYHGWAPWNKQLYSDSLKTEVINKLKEWHGDGFIEIPNPNRNPLQSPTALAKIDGNRKILIYTLDEAKVRVDYIDMIAEKEIEAVRKAAGEDK